MKRRTFLKQLGLTTALPWVGHYAFGAERPAENAPRSHKILSCNVRVDLPEDGQGGNGWADRKELCADVIKAQRADVVCLQECQPTHLKDLKARMPEFDSYALINSDPVPNPSNAILFSRSRYELFSAGGFWLSENPHLESSKSWDSARSRFVNWIHLKDRCSGSEFRVWNSHFDHVGQTAREKQAQLIVQASAGLSKEFPQIFTADCNAGVSNPAIKAILDGGWIDTYASVHGAEDPGFTFHGFKGKRAPVKTAKGAPRFKIDWIFYRGPIKTLKAEIIRDSRNDRYPSDHYFVSAEVSF